VRWVLCWLAMLLLLQGSLASMLSTLGPAHTHAVALTPVPLLDLRRGVVMSTWSPELPAQATQRLHPLQRHHHGAADSDLTLDNAAQLADAQAASAALLALWLFARPAPSAVPMALSGGLLHPPWRGWFVATGKPHPLERPPRLPRLF
jgi:hypothetical protein